MPVMDRQELLLPLPAQQERLSGYTDADLTSGSRISAWLRAGTERLRRAWRPPGEAGALGSEEREPEDCVEPLIRILLHHTFNYQSRGRLAPLLEGLRQNLRQQVRERRPITFFFLYNGGYRASPLAGGPRFIFRPDQTELALLFQIAALQERVAAVYPAGIDFVIVVNNGVSSWVNHIPCATTEAYAAELRRMIRASGAESGIRVLVQSEVEGYGELDPDTPVTPRPALSAKEHEIVERFLGRRCGEAEARHLNAFYALSESIWAEQLRPIAAAQHAILFRQVAHPSTLSFRPFAGGAIRVQNGTLGFHESEGRLIPRLVTACLADHMSVRPVPVAVPGATVDDPGPGVGHA